MKWLFVLLFAFYVYAIDYHETLDDNYDAYAVGLEEMRNLLNCLMHKGPCSDVYQSYKDLFPHVIEEACGRCNDEQKVSARSFMKRLREDLPEQYVDFKNYFDPNGKYMEAFEAAVA